MYKKNDGFKLNQTYVKLLDVINELNERKAFPKEEGLRKIINGVVDEETINFKDLPMFGCLLSYKGRKLASKINMLFRYEYLRYTYENIEDINAEGFLLITYKGISELEEFKKHHELNYCPKVKQIKKTILFKKE